MHLDESKNVQRKHAESSMLMNGLGLLSQPLKAAILLSLASCVGQQGKMPTQWNYGRITRAQADAAQVRAPIRTVAPGTPIPYHQVQNTRIAEAKPHPYPKNSQSATPWCMRDVVSDAPQRQAFYDARYGGYMYQIRQGDTRSEIEKYFGLTPQQLQLLNPLLPANPHLIHAGYMLRVR